MIRKAIIVILALAALGTAGAWIDSYRWRSGQVYGFGESIDLGKYYILLAWEDADRESPSASQGTGVILGSPLWSLQVENTKGSIEITLESFTPTPQGGSPVRRYWGFEYSSGTYLNGLWFKTLEDGSQIQGYVLVREAIAPLWAVLLSFATYPAFAYLFGPYRRWRRRRNGWCLACGYDLQGNISGRCPECGAIIRRIDGVVGDCQ